jgi:UDP-3-O-acyl-N-acetylglucosamine deacetylase
MVEGNGFATGRFNRVRVDALDVPERWLSIGARRPKALDELEFLANGRCSRAGDVGPLEHVAAGLGIAGLEGWHLRAEHFDLPLLDGSASAWFEGARRVGTGRIPLRAWEGHVVDETLVGEKRGALKARSAEEFRLDVVWTEGPDGVERWSGGVAELRQLVGARTFIDVDTFIESRRHGELGGADVASGRLLRGARPVDESALELASLLGVDPGRQVWTGGDERVTCECAAHKALDLVGDLLLWLGHLPALHIEAQDAGHALHHRLGSRLRRLVV